LSRGLQGAVADAAAALSRALRAFDAVIVFASMGALVVACAVLTASAVQRYFFHAPTEWQDEASVFLLVGVTFGCGAWVQDRRGHVAIDAIASILPAWAEPLRRRAIDVLSLAFCALFSWKSWTLFAEAWEGGFTTSSSWAPPLWIPYSFMAMGMSLLTLRLLVQALGGRDKDGVPRAGEGAP
jgi:TRAP-type C4-dicarboxylate transport system permease small subunit